MCVELSGAALLISVVFGWLALGMFSCDVKGAEDTYMTVSICTMLAKAHWSKQITWKCS